MKPSTQYLPLTMMVLDVRLEVLLERLPDPDSDDDEITSFDL